MKEFESNQFYIFGTTGVYPEVGDYVRYIVSHTIPADGISNMNPDARIGWFEATESTEYDNANVLYHDISPEIFGEVFEAYQKYLGMPVYFWNGDQELSDEKRNALLGVGAKFCRDENHETRWFQESDCHVYKIGEHASK